jgi:hypothetical protein
MESNWEDYEVLGAYEQMVWASYEPLEDDFIDFLSYVPWTPKHKEVWSPRLANLLVNIGSIIDSTFKSYLESPILNTAKDIEKIRIDQGKQTINAFQKVYDAVYSFSDRDIYLLSPEEKLIPWSNWQKQDTPPWWTAYNKVKHDRFKNITKANLENTLNALSGLFLVCAILKEIRPYLVDIGIIKWAWHGKLYTGDLKQLLEENEPINDAFYPIIARSKLFGYIFRSTGEYEKRGFSIFSKRFFPKGSLVEP